MFHRQIFYYQQTLNTGERTSEKESPAEKGLVITHLNVVSEWIVRSPCSLTSQWRFCWKENAKWSLQVLRCKFCWSWLVLVLCSSNFFSKLDILANALVVCYQHYTLKLLSFISTTRVIIQIGSFSKWSLYNVRGRKLHMDESQQHLLITKTFFIYSIRLLFRVRLFW